MAARVIGQSQRPSKPSPSASPLPAPAWTTPSSPSASSCSFGPPAALAKPKPALALADLLYGGERNLITINMSEYQEAHTPSPASKASPPQAMLATAKAASSPKPSAAAPTPSFFLDECEKAHPDVLELFYQVLDKGMMEDGEGREIDFKNTIIILTSNACTDLLMKLTADPETTPSPEGLAKALKPEMNQNHSKHRFHGPSRHRSPISPAR